MTPELKNQWIEALRSNHYDQTIGSLHNAKLSPTSAATINSYCCLGVLCEITPKSLLPEWDGNYLVVQEKGFGGKTYFYEELAPSIKNRLGLSDSECTHLMEMNDEGQPFPIIADWIEVNVT